MSDGNLHAPSQEITPAMRRAEKVLEKHGVPDERAAYNQGERSKAKIDAIIADVQKANAEAEE